jgi:YVTN family beta-propeller protein
MYRVFGAALLVIFLAAPTLAGGRLFVACKGKKALQVLDADTGTSEFEIPYKGEPHQVAVTADGRLAYIGDALGYENTITVVDVEKRSVAREINFKPHLRPHGMALTRDGARLFATSAPTRAVVEMGTHPLQIQRTFTFFADMVENLVLTPDEKWLFASSSIDGNIQVIDLTKGAYDRAIISGDGAEGLDVSPDGKELWVANRRDQTIAVIDIAQRKRLQSLQCVGNPMHVYFTPAGDQVVVTLAVADRLAVFDRAKRSETARFEVGDFPYQLAFGESGGPVFVTCEVGDEVAVVDLAARKVLRRIPVGDAPEGIAYRSK